MLSVIDTASLILLLDVRRVACKLVLIHVEELLVDLKWTHLLIHLDALRLRHPLCVHRLLVGLRTL